MMTRIKIVICWYTGDFWEGQAGDENVRDNSNALDDGKISGKFYWSKFITQLGFEFFIASLWFPLYLQMHCLRAA